VGDTYVVESSGFTTDLFPLVKMENYPWAYNHFFKAANSENR